MKSMPGTKNPWITSLDSRVICADRPTGSAIVSALPGKVSLAVFPLTDRPSLTYLADHCHWDPVTTSRSTGCGSMWSTLFTVTSPTASSATMMASGATKNVVRAAGWPRVCTGSDSSPRGLRNRTMTMASMPQTNTNTGSASQRMMYQSPCTSCAFASSPGFTRPQPDVTSSSASSSARRRPPRQGPRPWRRGPGVVMCSIIGSSRGGERRDHADGDVRRAGAAAGLAGLPAGRHVVPRREIKGERRGGAGGDVTAVAHVYPVVLGLGALLLSVLDHVLGGLAGRDLHHHELVDDLERLLVGERDHERLVRRHGRRRAVVSEVRDRNVVEGGRARGGRDRRRGGGGERRDHADGDVRRAGAAAGLAGLPAGRHVVPRREIKGERRGGAGGDVTAVAHVYPVVLGLGALLLSVLDHVLGGLAGRDLHHHELVDDLERLLVGERDHERLVRRHGRRRAVVSEVRDRNVVEGGRARGGRDRRRGGGGERRDHADRDVRRAGPAAGLAGLPAGRHVVPRREVHGDRVAGVGGQRVAAVRHVDPVVLAAGPLLLGVVDHVLGGLACGQLQHHELVVDLERLLVGEPDDDR